MTKSLTTLILLLLPSVLFAESPDPEWPSVDWGTIQSTGRNVIMSVEKIPEGNQVSLPRLNNRMESLSIDGRPDLKVTLRPEPAHGLVL